MDILAEQPLKCTELGELENEDAQMSKNTTRNLIKTTEQSADAVCVTINTTGVAANYHQLKGITHAIMAKVGKSSLSLLRTEALPRIPVPSVGDNARVWSMEYPESMRDKLLRHCHSRH